MFALCPHPHTQLRLEHHSPHTSTHITHSLLSKISPPAFVSPSCSPPHSPANSSHKPTNPSHTFPTPSPSPTHTITPLSRRNGSWNLNLSKNFTVKDLLSWLHKFFSSLFLTLFVIQRCSWWAFWVLLHILYWLSWLFGMAYWLKTPGSASWDQHPLKAASPWVSYPSPTFTLLICEMETPKVSVF